MLCDYQQMSEVWLYIGQAFAPVTVNQKQVRITDMFCDELTLFEF